jgi:hypothetical protein
MNNQRRKIGAIVAVVVAISGGTLITHKRANDHATQPASAITGAPKPPSEQAVTALMSLPELKAWSEWIEKKSSGAAHGAVIAGDASATRTINGKVYQAYSFVENDPVSAHFWQGFYVTASGDSILVEDATSGDVVSVDEWRQKDHPLDRMQEKAPN